MAGFACFLETQDSVSGSTSSFKKRVAGSFGKAAETYDAAAVLQKRVAARTRLLLPPSASPCYVLDLGAGTGSETAQLCARYPSAEVVGLDLAQPMMAYAHKNHLLDKAGWCSGDIEHLPFKSDSFDLIYSSLAIQWCELSKVIKEIKRVLEPGGYFVFSSLAEGTMAELISAWRGVDKGNHTNTFEPFEYQKTCLERPQKLKLVSLICQSEIQYYSNTMRLLRELKALGVNTVHSANRGLMTRRKLNSFTTAYESFREERGLPLTYRVVYGVVRKDE